MKKPSIKLKLTAWLTLLMLILFGILLVFMLFISSTVTTETAERQLANVVQANIAEVEAEGGKPQFTENFKFYDHGVYMLVYSEEEALLAGQLPVGFSATAAFDSGLVRTIELEDTRFLVLDVWLPQDWEHGIWLRGLLEVPAGRQTAENLLVVALIALPLFMIMVALGAYFILRRAFRPLAVITETAESINEAKDLSLRIELPPGRDEFSRLSLVFNRLFGRLERSFEAEKQFTADASHELRTPVTIIKGACEYAEKYDETPEERQETLAMIHRQADKMGDLIARLLSLTRMEQGTEPVQLQQQDAGQLVAELCAELRYPAARLHNEVPTGLLVWADGVLLSRLVRNLIDNAFKYGRTDGQVWLAAVEERDEVLLKVRDDGPGIAAEEQDKIWQRFYQVDTSRSSEEGAGLGLAMVKQIAELHGGYMSLNSRPGEGSEFILHLPKKN